MLKGVHHIAYLVEDLDAAVHLIVNVLGASLLDRKHFDPSGVEVAVVRLGNVCFELVRPLREGTPASEHLRLHGPGFYHIGLEVDDIDKALLRLKAAGIGLIDEEPVPGVDWDVAWLETASTLGVPSQLVRPKGEGRHETSGGA